VRICKKKGDPTSQLQFGALHPKILKVFSTSSMILQIWAVRSRSVRETTPIWGTYENRRILMNKLVLAIAIGAVLAAALFTTGQVFAQGTPPADPQAPFTGYGTPSRL
jgi:hypothetical protein